MNINCRNWDGVSIDNGIILGWIKLGVKTLEGRRIAGQWDQVVILSGDSLVVVNLSTTSKYDGYITKIHAAFEVET